MLSSRIQTARMPGAARPFTSRLVLRALIPALFLGAGLLHAGNPLATPSGFAVGVQASDYIYREPSLGVELAGSKLGVEGSFTTTGTPEFPFVRFELRYAEGRLDYEGSGTMDRVPDRSLEGRMLIGKDYFPGARCSLTPFIGFGYRQLRNDLRGRTSTGAIGYRRISHYRYIPLGASMRIRATSEWIVAPTAEFDVFMSGTQKSKLADTGLGLSDASNRQEGGYGYRVSCLFERGRISFGPWLHYWRIKKSDLDIIAPGLGAYEPANWTRELGGEFRIRF